MRLIGWLAAVLAATGLAWWLWPAPAQPAGTAEVAGATTILQTSASAAGPASSAVPTAAGARPPFRADAAASMPAARALELQRWQQRLERAQASLQSYRVTTRYPFDSRPASEQPDQLRPNDPIVEELALRAANGQVIDGVRLRTSQDRVFVQGSERVRFLLTLVDAQGRAQPLRVLRAAARELPPVNTAATFADVPLNVNDAGVDGDAVAGDRTYGTALQPATQGFAGLLGPIRVDVHLEVRGQQTHAFFDILYTPRPPATWQGGVRESMEEGSLVLSLPVQVEQAGRYVVSGRVDDAQGRPFALLGFNDELAAGAQVVRLRVFGKLVRDAQPAFPLTLRDVDGFLLRPDAFPDRLLMPRRTGIVHTTAVHPLTAFSEREWTSEERERYLAELTRDVEDAQRQLERLGGRP